MKQHTDEQILRSINATINAWEHLYTARDRLDKIIGNLSDERRDTFAQKYGYILDSDTSSNIAA